MLAILVGVMDGCASSAEVAAQATATQLACKQSYHCHVVVPSCGPAITTAQGRYGIWYRGFQAPGNVETLIGFRPLLSTWIPDAADSDSVVVAGPDVPAGQPLPDRATLFHAGYAAWPDIGEDPQLQKDRVSVLGLDEGLGPIGPLTYLDSSQQSLRVVGQQPTTVGGVPATVYHLAPVGASADTAYAVETLWQLGPVTLRLLGVRGAMGLPGERVGIALTSTTPSEVDAVEAWHAHGTPLPVDVDDFQTLLLRMAASAAPLGDCAGPA